MCFAMSTGGDIIQKIKHLGRENAQQNTCHHFLHMKTCIKKVIGAILLACLLAACAPTQTPASRAVESFLQALADKDESLMLSRVCTEYESGALLELDALAQVQTKLKDVSCQQVETDGDAALVTCNGSIASNYGSQFFSYGLTGRTYRVEEDGDHLLVCGYTR